MSVKKSLDTNSFRLLRVIFKSTLNSSWVLSNANYFLRYVEIQSVRLRKFFNNTELNDLHKRRAKCGAEACLDEKAQYVVINNMIMMRLGNS